MKSPAGTCDKTAAAGWLLPDRLVKEDGQPRRVGVEFELQGIPVDQLARLTAFTLRGKLSKLSDAEFHVAVSGQGDYRVEVDYALLKSIAREQEADGNETTNPVEALAVDVISAASSVVVPCEIVTPPLEMTAAGSSLKLLTEAVRDAGGKGTRHSPLYAFGVHLNVEPPALDARTILAYMKAFVCLFDWIAHAGDIDLTRRLTPYIQRFPRDYEVTLTDSDYWPDIDTLLVDYLKANPTRNRALDMLPLLASLNAAAVRVAVDDGRVNARPAFHYRLANCLIDEPGWSIADPWHRWLQIERLAGNIESLNTLCEEYRADRTRLFHRVNNNWRNHVAERIEAW